MIMMAGPCEVAREARDCQLKKNSRCETDRTKRVKINHNVDIFKIVQKVSCSSHLAYWLPTLKEEGSIPLAVCC